MLPGKIVQFVLNTMGWNERMTFAAMQTSAALRRITARGIEVGTVVDIGASNGSWSKSVMPFFPSARYLLVEAQNTHEVELKKFVEAHPNAEYILKAAGEKPGTIFFDASEAFAGQALTKRTRADLVELPVCSIDEEVRSRNLPGPFLLKFDVHGFELSILRGAEQALANTSLLIMECSTTCAATYRSADSASWICQNRYGASMTMRFGRWICSSCGPIAPNSSTTAIAEILCAASLSSPRS
jgi:FkbM family methyltransferase